MMAGRLDGAKEAFIMLTFSLPHFGQLPMIRTRTNSILTSSFLSTGFQFRCVISRHSGSAVNYSKKQLMLLSWSDRYLNGRNHLFSPHLQGVAYPTSPSLLFIAKRKLLSRAFKLIPIWHLFPL